MSTTTTTLPVELPGFSEILANSYGNLLAESDRRIWSVSRLPIRNLTPGKVRKARDIIAKKRPTATDIPVAFGTPVLGRCDYNVRASFPADSLRRNVPFLVLAECEEGVILTAYLVRPTHAFRPLSTQA